MNKPASFTISCLIGLGILGFLAFTGSIQTQANETPTTPLDDGARHLRGLDPKTAADWNFVIDKGNQLPEDYRLRTYKSDIRIVEQEIPEWRNTGDDPNYSVLIDIDNLLEEDSR